MSNPLTVRTSDDTVCLKLLFLFIFMAIQVKSLWSATEIINVIRSKTCFNLL